ncbi:DUF6879 family protein [Kitasatospora sp. LaBMicrA B282]|uniref:DUF6879 family protein n=1 Tax=Kitasatospora sp. LaBMicrA B282 TaxID=3420949 RepID=UPI003D115D3C
MAEHRETLLRLGLLLPTGRQGELAPADPAIAEILLRTPLEAEIHRRQQELARIHEQLQPLASLFAERTMSSRRDQGVRCLDDPSEVRRELSMMTRLCAREMVSIQPGGGRNPDTLRGIVAESRGMLERGVRLRTLYQHTARASLATQTYVREVSAAGAQVRTTAEMFDRLIIFDGETAFVPQARANGLAQGASIVTDPTVVGFLCRMFESAWDSGMPFESEPGEYHHTAERLRASMLKLMAAGLKDEAVAKRLGMTARTCRRYMKEIMDDLGATSRFQAGYKVWRLGLRLERAEVAEGEDWPGE